MAGSDWTAIIVALVGLSGVFYQARRPRTNLRDKISSDISIYSSLPDASLARPRLLSDIELNVTRLINGEERTGSDPLGMLIGLVTAVASGWLAWWMAGRGGASLVVSALFAIAGVVGLYLLVRSTQEAVRDEAGRPLTDQHGNRRAPRHSLVPLGFRRVVVEDWHLSAGPTLRKERPGDGEVVGTRTPIKVA